MRNATPITEQFQHFVEDLKEDFWGDLNSQTRDPLKQFLKAESVRERTGTWGWSGLGERQKRRGTAPTRSMKGAM